MVSPTLCKSRASEHPRTTSVIVTQEILDLTRRDAERIYVRKQRDYHGVHRDEINQLMVRLARTGKRVLRLKGGDPFILGRGGEEIGIPGSARDYRRLRLCRLHRNPSYPSGLCAVLRVRYRTRARRIHGSELGCASAATTDDRDLHGSKRTDTLVSTADKTWNVFRYAGSTYRTGHYTAPAGFVGTLKLPETISAADVHAPTLVIFGDVVRLQQKLAWFQPRQ